MKTLVLCAFTVAAASPAVLAGACSSDDSSGSSGTSGTSGTSGASGASGTSGTTGAPAATSSATVAEKDTCKPAGGSCQCSCSVTGQTLDKTKHCLQPAQDTGLCPQVCCTGEPTSTSSSSGTTGTIADAGDGG